MDRERNTKTEAEAVDYELEDNDYLTDADGAVDVESSPRGPAPPPKLKSAITSGDSAAKKTKGRGFREEGEGIRQRRLSGRDFDSIGSDGGPDPQRSISSIVFSFFHPTWFGSVKTRLNLALQTSMSPPHNTTKTTTFWGYLFIITASVSFIVFLFASVISKLLQPSANPLVASIQNDRYYCFLLPLTLPILVIAVYFHWLSMKIFKHA